MPATISDLWNPDRWLASTQEKMATFPSLFRTGIVVRNAKAQELAAGAGETAIIPFFKDITDQDDEIQVEDTAPVTDNGITGAQMKAVACNRVTKNSATALAGQVSDEDVVGAMTAQIAERRLKQRQKTFLAGLRGAFGSGAGASGNTDGCLSDLKNDKFDETGTDATDEQLMNVNLFIDSKALMGELADSLMDGALFIHPNVLAGLEKADITAFDKVSRGPWTVRTYREVPIVVSESLVRAGTGNGYVYDTYLIANGVVAYGEKPQVGGQLNNPILDVASLNIEVDAAKNNGVIYDRTRFVLHVNGLKWVGTPAGESPTNAELQTATNWNLVYQTANRVGAVCIRTNG